MVDVSFPCPLLLPLLLLRFLSFLSFSSDSSPSSSPSPQIPRLNSDTELSCLSLLEESPTHPSPSTTHPTRPPLSTSHLTCPPPTADKSNHSSLTDRQTTPVHASSHPSTIGSDVKVFPEKQSAMEQLLWRQEQQLRALQEQVKPTLSLLTLVTTWLLSLFAGE